MVVEEMADDRGAASTRSTYEDGSFGEFGLIRHRYR